MAKIYLELIKTIGKAARGLIVNAARSAGKGDGKMMKKIFNVPEEKNHFCYK